MTEPAPDAAATAWLTAAREPFAIEKASDDRLGWKSVAGVEEVLKMVDGYTALLTQARRWTDEAAALLRRSCEAPVISPNPGLLRARAQALADCAGELREVIEMKLTGEDS